MTTGGTAAFAQTDGDTGTTQTTDDGNGGRWGLLGLGASPAWARRDRDKSSDLRGGSTNR